VDGKDWVVWHYGKGKMTRVASTSVHERASRVGGRDGDDSRHDGSHETGGQVSPAYRRRQHTGRLGARAGPNDTRRKVPCPASNFLL
jgi:hypothetical protein